MTTQQIKIYILEANFTVIDEGIRHTAETE